MGAGYCGKVDGAAASRDQSPRSRVHKKCLTLAPRICSSMHPNAALLIAAKLYTQMGKVALNIQASLKCCEMVQGIRLG